MRNSFRGRKEDEAQLRREIFISTCMCVPRGVSNGDEMMKIDNFRPDNDMRRSWCVRDGERHTLIFCWLPINICVLVSISPLLLCLPTNPHCTVPQQLSPSPYLRAFIHLPTHRNVQRHPLTTQKAQTNI